MGQSNDRTEGGRKGKRAKSSDDSNSKKGWADVAIRLIDALYDLAQTGNIIGLFMFAFICWILLVTYRVPTDEIGAFGRFILSERFYLFPLGSALSVSVITNIIQAKVYKSHIVDLVNHRKVLVHGLETGELTPLKHHTSSGFDIQSGYPINEKKD